jgi:hypothetical protein
MYHNSAQAQNSGNRWDPEAIEETLERLVDEDSVVKSLKDTGKERARERERLRSRESERYRYVV